MLPCCLLSFYLLLKPGSHHLLLSLSSRRISAGRCLISDFHPGSFHSVHVWQTPGTARCSVCSERRILLRFLAAPVPEFGVATSRGSEGDHGCSDTTGTPAKGGPCHLSPCLLPLPSFRSKSQRNGSTRFLPLLGWSKAESPHVRCSITVASINSGTVP